MSILEKMAQFGRALLKRSKEGPDAAMPAASQTAQEAKPAQAVYPAVALFHRRLKECGLSVSADIRFATAVEAVHAWRHLHDKNDTRDIFTATGYAYSFPGGDPADDAIILIHPPTARRLDDVEIVKITGISRPSPDMQPTTLAKFLKGDPSAAFLAQLVPKMDRAEIRKVATIPQRPGLIKDMGMGAEAPAAGD